MIEIKEKESLALSSFRNNFLLVDSSEVIKVRLKYRFYCKQMREISKTYKNPLQFLS